MKYTLSLSPRKKGGLVICWGGRGPAGVGWDLLVGLGPGQWREVAGGVPNGGGPGERPDPQPPAPHHKRARLGLSVQFGTEMYGFPKSSCRFISFPSLSFY